MSKTAICLLSATAICAVLVAMFPMTGLWATASKAGLIVFAVLSFFALLAGRRFKFDPILR